MLRNSVGLAVLVLFVSASLCYMSIRAGVIRSISFQKVDAAPDTKARAQGNYQRLQYVYRAIEKSHTSSLSAALRQSKKFRNEKGSL